MVSFAMPISQIEHSITMGSAKSHRRREVKITGQKPMRYPLGAASSELRHKCLMRRCSRSGVQFILEGELGTSVRITLRKMLCRELNPSIVIMVN
jgi:hypothetical protein